jgi:dienelactone hydrolase
MRITSVVCSLCMLCMSSVLDAAPNDAASASGLADRPVHDDIRAALREVKPALRYRGDSAAEFERWRTGFRAQLETLVGESAPPPRWTVVEEGRVVLDDHTRYELLLEAPGVPSVPLYLLIPRTLPPGERAPAVLCVHGHGTYGHHPIVGRTDLEGVAESIELLRYDFGLQFVRRGYVVAAPCLIPFGRRVDRERYGGKDPCAITFVRMQTLGQLPMAANLRDLRWTLGFLESRDEVDAKRLGCAGLSYGGRMTMLVSALDERIRVAAVSGALNLMEERMTGRHSCGSQIIPGLLKYGDHSEIGSLIAPRPCVWEIGSKDPLLVSPWKAVFKERLERAYRSLGAAKNLRFDHFEGGHRWNGDVAFPLFDQVLK